MSNLTPEESLKLLQKSKEKSNEYTLKPTKEKSEKKVTENNQFIKQNDIKLETLPSLGKSYNPKMEIKIRPFLFGEVKMLISSQLKIKDTIEKISKGITISHGNYKDLTMQDFLFLNMLRILFSFKDNDNIVEYKCSKCGHYNKLNVQLNQYVFKNLEAEKLPISTTIEGKKYSFMPMTVGDFLFLQSKEKEEDIVAIMAISACEKDDYSDFDEKLKEFDNFSISEAKFLEFIYKKLEHSVENIEGKCSKCNNINTIQVNDPYALLEYPFRKPEQSGEKSFEDRINYGN